MNILFICDEYPPGRNGGIGTMVQVLGRELVKQGHEVYVAGLYSYRYGQADYEEDQGVKVWRMRYGLNLHTKPESRWYNLLEKLPAIIRRNLNGQRAFQKYVDFVHQLVDKAKIDVIEIQDWNTFANHIGFIVEWPEFKAPLVLKSNGSHTYFSDEMHVPANKTLQQTDRLLYKRADALSAVSKYTADRNRVLFDITTEIGILYNSINIPTHPEQVRQPQTIVFTGTLIEKKGVFSLVKAWDMVHKALPQAKLLVYGKGKTAPLQAMLSAEALSSVEFRGHATREVLFDELSKATMAIFPSYSECFALAPMEAMAVGCPVLNSARSSGPELVTNGENGGLVDPDDVEGLASAIIKLIQNKALQEQYSAEGKKTVTTRFNITRSAQDHIAYYQQVLQQYP